jgi:hypothetical protein
VHKKQRQQSAFRDLLAKKQRESKQQAYLMGLFAKSSTPVYKYRCEEAAMGDHVATPELIKDYFDLFVNRREYTVQSRRQL